MKTDQQNIVLLRSGFERMQTKDDLLVLLNQAKQIIYGEETHPFRLKAISFYANPKIATDRYREFTINKKSGGIRKIHAPVNGLKTIQRCLNLILQSIFEPGKAATGFVPGRSIVTNAMVHKGMHYVYNVDLKDFFPSIDFRRVKTCLGLQPFELNDTKADGRDFLAFIIANLCCTSLDVERKSQEGLWKIETKSVLPQGAPTSPTITNIVSQKLDRKLSGLARRFGLNYSRYADDITFSSLHNVYQAGSEFIIELNRIIERQRFDVNPKKTRLQKSCYRQEVTGLLVNEKPNVHRRYIKQVRTMIHNWEKLEYVEANKVFLANYIPDKGHLIKGNPNFLNVLSGKLEFLKMVRGINDPTYVRLDQRFQLLVKKQKENQTQLIDFDNIIETLSKEGLEKAMSLFDRFKNQYNGC